MALASSSSIVVRAAKETTFGVIPVSAAPSVLRTTGETFKFNISKESSKEINDSRTVSSKVPVTANSSGGINSEIYYGGNDDLLESTLQGVWAKYGTNGVGTAITANATTGAITASSATTGTNLFTLLQPGQWFRNGGTGLNAGKILRVHPTTLPTSTVLTLDPSTPAIASTGEAWVIQSSRLTHGKVQTSWTLERQNTDIGVFIAYTGMTPSKMTASIASGSLSSMNFEFMGKGGVASNSTAFSGTPIDPPATEIHSGVAGASLAVWQDGAPITGTYVKSVNISFDNTLRSQEAIGTLGAVGIGSGTIQCTLALQIYFANKATFDKFVANTNGSFAFHSTDNDGNGYVFTIPKANYSEWTSNGSAKDQDQMIDLSVTALRDSANPVAALRQLLFIDRFGSGVSGQVTVDTRPRYFLAPASAYNTGTQAFIDGATAFGSNNSVVGSFPMQTSAGNYGWLAVPASAAPNGIHISNTTDGLGGWSGAGLAGNNTGASPDPTVVSTTFTDSLGRAWKLFRMDYVNSAPSSKNFDVTAV